VSVEDSLCTLQEAFEKVDLFIGFNIELKFDDEIQYTEDQLRHILQVILEDVHKNAQGRQIFFSSFHPDAAQMVRKLQDTYPVLFLTDGGVHKYLDFRRNSFEEAVKVCITGGLQGIVTEVRAILQDPGAISKIKESDLCLLTYGQLNNVPETVYLQNLIGIDGVIVDFGREISAAIEGFTRSNGKMDQSTDSQTVAPQIESIISCENQEKEPQNSPPSFSPRELSFILKLIPQLMQSQ
jgi:glycerophosphodiester phosphodiesterase